LKSIATILLCIALALLIEYVIESAWPQEDTVNIVGAENDSVGGRYIYLSNGDVYHRRAPSGLGTGGSSYNASSFETGTDMSDWQSSALKQEDAGNPPPAYSRDRGLDEGR
jgi:hypothetical protein